MCIYPPGANVQKGKHLETPLHAAAQHSSTEIVNLLLEFGADINAKNTDFERPVDLAAPSSLVERLLLLHEGKFYVCVFATITCILKKNPNKKKPKTKQNRTTLPPTPKTQQPEQHML